MTGLAWLTLLSLLVPASSGGEEVRAREADLRKLDEWIDLERSFTDERRKEAHAAVAAHLAQEMQFTDPELYMEVRRIVALADNGHSNADVDPIFERFGLLPLRTYWFSDGLYVVRAREPQRKLLGARIVTVEGRPVGDLETRLKAYCGGTVEYFRHYTEALLLLSPALMHAVGLAERPDRLRLGVVDGKGESAEAVVEVDLGSSNWRAQPWRRGQGAAGEQGRGDHEGEEQGGTVHGWFSG